MTKDDIIKAFQSLNAAHRSVDLCENYIATSLKQRVYELNARYYKVEQEIRIELGVGWRILDPECIKWPEFDSFGINNANIESEYFTVTMYKEDPYDGTVESWTIKVPYDPANDDNFVIDFAIATRTKILNKRIKEKEQ